MKIQNLEEYREALAKIRKLRGSIGSDDDNPELQSLEAAAAEFSQRLDTQEPAIGRPPRKKHG